MKAMKKFVKHYHILPLICLLLFFAAADQLICRYVVLQVNSPLYSMLPEDKLPLYFHIAAGTFYLYICFDTIRQITYADKTGGRNFRSDYAKYHKTYGWLTSYFHDNTKLHINPETLPVAKWYESEGVILGKKENRIIHKPSDAAGNITLFGLPGTGKTASVIIPTAICFSGSILCIDIKGDIEPAVRSYTKNQRKIKVFNPEDPESLHFDILAGVEDMNLADRELLIKSLCDIIIPPSEKDRYFIPNARNLFCGICLYLLDQDVHMDFSEIIRQILTGDPIQWVITIRSSSCQIAQEYTNHLFGEKPEHVCGCYTQCADAVKSTFSIGSSALLFNRTEHCISPKDLEDGYDIYLRIPQDKISVYAPMTTVICDTFMRYFMQKDDIATGQKPRPILFMLDEFPQLHFNFQAVSAALATLRSKGVSLLLAQQSAGQIEERYGSYGFKQIMDMCRYTVIMSAKDPGSARYFQEMIGTQKILTVSVSKSKNGISKSVSESREPIYQLTDLQRLGDHVVIQYDGSYIEAEKTFYFK